MTKQYYLFKTKGDADKALIESVKAFYILIAVMIFFAIHTFFQGNELFSAVLVFQSLLIFLPIVIIHKKSSRVASIVLLLLVSVNLIGLFMLRAFSFSWFLNAGFVILIILLSLRILVATVVLQSRDTILS